MDKAVPIDLGMVQKIVVKSMNLLYREVPNDIKDQKKAWLKFEEHFPSLTGRKMYGFDYSNSKIYRVCSLVSD